MLLHLQSHLLDNRLSGLRKLIAEDIRQSFTLFSAEPLKTTQPALSNSSIGLDYQA